jgi:hypothetical protein
MEGLRFGAQRYRIETVEKHTIIFIKRSEEIPAWQQGTGLGIALFRNLSVQESFGSRMPWFVLNGFPLEVRSKRIQALHKYTSSVPGQNLKGYKICTKTNSKGMQDLQTTASAQRKLYRNQPIGMGEGG